MLLIQAVPNPTIPAHHGPEEIRTAIPTRQKSLKVSNFGGVVAQVAGSDPGMFENWGLFEMCTEFLVSVELEIVFKAARTLLRNGGVQIFRSSTVYSMSTKLTWLCGRKGASAACGRATLKPSGSRPAWSPQ
jgi:hypothetical protein